MKSPDRGPQELRDPALKITPGMLAAFDIASDYAERHKAVTVRIIDADVLLGPCMLTRRAPRNVVEVFIDPTGVLVVATGTDSFHPAYRAAVSLPDPDCEGCVAAFEAVLSFEAAWAARAIARQAAFGLPGPASP